MRTARIKVVGQAAVYHCISRIIGGRRLLQQGEREVLRKQMRQVAAFCGVKILTYAILSNHFHILVRVPLQPEFDDEELLRRLRILYAPKPEIFAVYEGLLKAGGTPAENVRRRLAKRMGDVSFFMKELKQRFSIWFNHNHGHYGTLWAERFKSVLVEDRPVARRTVAAYIDLNGMRAGLARTPEEYRWCGYAEAVAGHAVAQKGLVEATGERNWQTAQRAYRVMLFLQGTWQVKGRTHATISVEEARRVIESGGRLPVAAMLRCRLRYFTDGAVLGSLEFVQAWIQANRRHLGWKRQAGPRPMAGADWGGLAVGRRLRRGGV